MATLPWVSGYSQTLTIASGQTASDILDFRTRGTGRKHSMMIFAPATLPESVRVQVAPNATSATWYDVQSGGADVVIAAGKAQPLEPLVAGAMRLLAGSAVGAARAFIIQGHPES